MMTEACFLCFAFSPSYFTVYYLTIFSEVHRTLLSSSWYFSIHFGYSLFIVLHIRSEITLSIIGRAAYFILFNTFEIKTYRRVVCFDGRNYVNRDKVILKCITYSQKSSLL